MTGILVVAEGIDASGKTSVLYAAKELLEDKGYSCRYVKGLRSKTVFGILAHVHTNTWTLFAELYAIDRYFVCPALEKYDIVLQDRSWPSLVVHHEFSSLEKRIGKIIIPKLSVPDFLTYFTVDDEKRNARLLQRRNQRDLLLLESGWKAVETRYDDLLQEYQGTYSILDTTKKSVEESANDLVGKITKFKSLNPQE
ncbi:MAG: hypothetical protein ABIJ21_08835 [Nanoarchaeota archaeon]